MDKKKDINCLGVVNAGIGRDDEVSQFWDYVYTFEHMKLILEEKGFKPPFIIKSDKFTKMACCSGNHIKSIIKQIDETINISLEDIEDNNIYVLSDKVALNEYDYIMSRNWIEAWIIEDQIEDWKYHLKLEKDGKYVISGVWLTLEF